MDPCPWFCILIAKVFEIRGSFPKCRVLASRVSFPVGRAPLPRVKVPTSQASYPSVRVFEARVWILMGRIPSP